MRRKEKNYEKHVRETAGDYTVKKSRVLDNFAKVLTLILAVAIWLYVVAVNDVTAIEKSVPLSVKESDGLLSSDLVNFDLASVVIKGDAKVLAIAAASIIAKVTRDLMMVEYDEQYPGYAFAKNKGYGTKAHYEGIHAQGICPIHRKTFLKNLEL